MFIKHYLDQVCCFRHVINASENFFINIYTNLCNSVHLIDHFKNKSRIKK